MWREQRREGDQGLPGSDESISPRHGQRLSGGTGRRAVARAAVWSDGGVAGLVSAMPVGH